MDRITLSELEFVAGSPEAVGTKHGITLISETSRRTDDGVHFVWRMDGAWRVCRLRPRAMLTPG